jgi:hypothetical protein
MLARRAQHWNASPPILHTGHGWWLEEAGAAEPCAPPARDITVDSAIVGGGYTGMRTARTWAASTGSAQHDDPGPQLPY